MRTRDIEAMIKRSVREEVRKEVARLNLVAKPKRKRRCGWPPECMGAAARGSDFCTCK